MKKKISKIKSSEDLARVLDAVQRELVSANCFYRLFRDLNAALPEYQWEMNQSPVFWYLTRDGLLDAATLRLYHVYERDSEQTANDLGFLLAAIKRNLHMFDFDSFRERAASNIHLDPHSSWREIDEQQLDEDIAFATESNNSVRRLVRWRDKRFVHRDSTYVIQKREFDQSDLPTYGDIES